MKKREWIYIKPPINYEISCDLCNGENIDWSEFECMIWCYDCHRDTPGTGGIFSGPIPVHVCEMLDAPMHRYYLKEKEIRLFTETDHGMEYVPWCCPLPKTDQKNDLTSP